MKEAEAHWYERISEAANVDVEAALEVCELGLRAHPDSHGLHFLSGDIYTRFGQPHLAVEALRHATELNRQHLGSWRELSRAFVGIAQTSEDKRKASEAWLSAAESLTRVIDVRPLDAAALLDRASALTQIDDRTTRVMACVDALAALSTGTLSDATEERANQIARGAVGESDGERKELSRQVVDRVRALATDNPLAGARLAREAARTRDASYGMFAAVLFADIGEVQEALVELGASLECVGSSPNPLNLAAEADMPVSNPAAVANVWRLATTQRYRRD